MGTSNGVKKFTFEREECRKGGWFDFLFAIVKNLHYKIASSDVSGAKKGVAGNCKRKIEK